MLTFDKNGPDNTAKTIAIAVEEAVKRDTFLVVTSRSGNTAVAALGLLEERGEAQRLRVVGRVCIKGKSAVTEENRAILDKAGVPVVAAAHVLSGAERSFSAQLKGVYPVEIMAHTLRILSQGVKVAVEVAVMALDAGVIPYGTPVVSVGGTSNGADTAILISPANAQDILNTRLHEIYCKPFEAIQE